MSRKTKDILILSSIFISFVLVIPFLIFITIPRVDKVCTTITKVHNCMSVEGGISHGHIECRVDTTWGRRTVYGVVVKGDRYCWYE